MIRQLHAPIVTLHPLRHRKKKIRGQLIRKLSGPHSRCGQFRTKTNLLPLPGIESQFLDRPLRSLAITTTTIYRLTPKGMYKNYVEILHM